MTQLRGGNDPVGHVRLGHKRFKAAQVDANFIIVSGPLVCRKGNPVFFPSLSFEETASNLVTRED